MEIDQLVGGMGGVGTKKWEGGGGVSDSTQQLSAYFCTIWNHEKVSKFKVKSLYPADLSVLQNVWHLYVKTRQDAETLGTIQTS